MGRFGGWQAKWLASVVMMTGEGTGSENGMSYRREIITNTPVGRASKDSHKLPTGLWVKAENVRAEIYMIGIVDIDEAWLCALIPEINRRDKFLKGDESGFFAE